MKNRFCSLCGEGVEEHGRAVEHVNIWRIPGRTVRVPISPGSVERREPKEVDALIHQMMHRVTGDGGMTFVDD